MEWDFFRFWDMVGSVGMESSIVVFGVGSMVVFLSVGRGVFCSEVLVGYIFAKFLRTSRKL